MIQSLAFIALLFLSVVSHGQELSLDLAKGWKWNAEPGAKRGETGNTITGWHRPDFDDSSWESLTVGKTWESQGKQFNGIAWYRKSFRLDERFRSQELVLSLGTPNDGCEVYFNGKSLGIWRFKESVQVVLPSELVRWDGRNVLAVRVWDWHKQGGLLGSVYELRSVSTVAGQQSYSGPHSLGLHVTTGLPEDPLESQHWRYGWRDAGTSDTRPNLRTVRNVFHGQDAIEMDTWYPNSTEFMDYELAPNENGAVWARSGYSFLTFWYRSDDLTGDISIRLSAGKHTWKRRAPVYQSLVRVSPGPWRQVILPLSGFTKPNPNTTLDHAHRLSGLDSITHVSIGYGNHHLTAPGKIQFADFRVARGTSAGLPYEAVDLAGHWQVHAEPAGSPEGLTIDRLTTEDRRISWSVYDTDSGKPAKRTQTGSIWYRKAIQVPANWQGKALRLVLGRAQGETRLFWNGVELQEFEKNDAMIAEIEPDRIQSGRENTILVHATDGKRSFPAEGPLQILPTTAAEILLAAPGVGAPPAPPERFEMGPKPPEGVELIFRFEFTQPVSEELVLQYQVLDCFDRMVTHGATELAKNGSKLESRLALDSRQTRLLYYGEWFRVRASILDQSGQVVAAYSLPDSAERHYKLQFQQRDDLQLPPLGRMTERTSLGPLRLVDVVQAGTDPDSDSHPYKEGGIRNSWVGRRANYPWQNGIRLGSLEGRPYREAANNQFFAYRIGRGRLKPRKAYLLRILVPDDKSRYFVMDIKAGRNSQGTGYFSVRSRGSPQLKYDVSGKYHWYDHIVINDDVTYGYRGSRTASSGQGFWVVFHDIGRAYAAAYDAGPAVAEIRLYEIPDDLTPERRTRAFTRPSRLLMMDWERQPESPPQDVVRYAQLAGLNAVAPTIQKWAFHGFWHSQLGFKPPDWYKTAAPDQDDRDIYQSWLDATRRSGITLIPRVEYGGGPNLPREAWVIGPNGKIDPVGRYARWGANILHPATLAEMKQLLDELIGDHVDKNPQLGGIFWRQRQDRIQCSYGRRDIELFARETGTAIPPGNDRELAEWAHQNPDYATWWQHKRAEFLIALRDHLRSYREDLVLYYYNWDQDHWSPGLPKSRNKPSDWSDYYNVERARSYAQRRAQRRATLTPEFYRDFLIRQSEPHRNIHPDMFETEPGIRIFAPIPQPYLSANPLYLNHFKTHDGLAVANVLSYEERARWNLQGDRYETSELTPGPGPSSMINELNASRTAGANAVTTTSYTYGRGWLREFKQFSDSFLNPETSGP